MSRHSRSPYSYPICLSLPCVLCSLKSSFFQDLHRIIREDYMPKNDDILQFYSIPHHHTVSELVLKTNSIPYRLIDIQPRGERKKVIHLLDNVAAVLFLADISLYDEMLEEDASIASIIPIHVPNHLPIQPHATPSLPFPSKPSRVIPSLPPAKPANPLPGPSPRISPPLRIRRPLALLPSLRTRPLLHKRR